MKKISKKKKGFTLLEVGAVLGIIMLLMSFFVPKVSGYIKDAKTTAVMAQAKTVIFAWETVNTKSNKNLGKDISKNSIISEAGSDYTEHFDLAKTKNLGGDVTVEDCMRIVDGEKFTVTPDGIFTGF